MANTLTPILYKILSVALDHLRGQLVMPVLVNTDYSADAAKKGATVDVPIPAAQTVSDVTPSNTPPTPASKAPTTVQIPLDQWKYTDFHLTDKELTEITRNEHFVPMQMQSAVDAIAETVNAYLFAKYLGIYGFTGTPGTTPFASTVAGATNLRKVLGQQKAPKRMRRMVLDPDAEANALALAPFSDAEKIGDAGVKLEGEIGRKYGFDCYMDQQVPTHTAGSLTGTIVTSGAAALGATSVTLATDAGEAIALKAGDIVTFAGDSQTYAVGADLTVGASSSGALTISPGLKVAQSGGEQISVKATHVVNMGFHRNAFAFAARPLLQETQDLALGNQIVEMQDPVTGIPLRLEVSRQHKQTVWTLDILYGGALVRPELAARLAG